MELADKFRLQVLMIGTFLDTLKYIKEGTISIEEIETKLVKTKDCLNYWIEKLENQTKEEKE